MRSISGQNVMGVISPGMAPYRLEDYSCGSKKLQGDVPWGCYNPELKVLVVISPGGHLSWGKLASGILGLAGHWSEQNVRGQVFVESLCELRG